MSILPTHVKLMSILIVIYIYIYKYIYAYKCIYIYIHIISLVAVLFLHGPLCGCPDGYFGLRCNEQPNYVNPTMGTTVQCPTYDSETQYVRFIIRVPREGATFNLDASSATVYVGQRVYPTEEYYDARYIIIPGASRTVYFIGNDDTVPYFVTVRLNSVPNFLGSRTIGTITGGGEYKILNLFIVK